MGFRFPTISGTRRQTPENAGNLWLMLEIAGIYRKSPEFASVSGDCRRLQDIAGIRRKLLIADEVMQYWILVCIFLF